MRVNKAYMGGGVIYDLDAKEQVLCFGYASSNIKQIACETLLRDKLWVGL